METIRLFEVVFGCVDEATGNVGVEENENGTHGCWNESKGDDPPVGCLMFVGVCDD